MALPLYVLLWKLAGPQREVHQKSKKSSAPLSHMASLCRLETTLVELTRIAGLYTD